MKQIKLLLYGLCATCFICGSVFAEQKEVAQFIGGTVRVSAEEMIDLIDEYEELVIIDCRKKNDITKGFIDGSINLPSTETNASSLAKYVGSKTTPILFYCNGITCGRSEAAIKIAITEGYSKIYWFRGGMQEWEAKDLPVAYP